MTVKQLFYEDWKDALRRTVDDSDKSWKEVAHHLRPDLKIDTAYAWLRACLKDGGDQKLDFGQAIALMKFCGQFDGLYHACDELCHDRPAPRAPEDEMTSLMREYVQSANNMQLMASRIEQCVEEMNKSKATSG